MENFKKISSLILLGILAISLFLNVRSCTKIDKDKYKDKDIHNTKIKKISLLDKLFNFNDNNKSNKYKNHHDIQ